MTKITPEKLMSMMANLEADEQEFAQYFIVDEDESDAFAPRFRLNPSTVEVPTGPDADQRAAGVMNSANWFARMNRRTKYYNKIGKGYSGPIIVAEGDSWFQYPLLLKDTIDHLMDTYAIYSLGAAGDLLKSMADKQEYVDALRDTRASVLLLSGGGNDLVAGGALAVHLEEFDPDLEPDDYLLPSFHRLLEDSLQHYGRMFSQVHTLFPHVSVLCHGYDNPVPNKDRWLGKPMESRGIRHKNLQKAIARSMIGLFNRRLRQLTNSMPHVTYIDCRGSVGDHRWHDGLHPTDDGYADVAANFDREISRIANQGTGPSRAVGGPFGSAAEIERSLPGTPAIAGGQPSGMSLHVGLNTVDPAHYDGWDGLLKACEADAHDMRQLAESEGFSPTMVLTRDATRANVISEIERAASELKAGDMFVFTVSGHGGRIPDFNQDEDHDGDEKMDETLCLYDFQLADDELYMLWTQFRPGVRVLVVPDTCHSGSMIRMGSTQPAELFGRTLEVGPAVRSMPLHVEDGVWRANEAAYREASRSYSSLKESILTSPLSTPIRASVLNLGACKDTQFAMDGPQNGAFTGALLEVWNDGSFNQDYRSFRDAIDARINSASQTPQLFEQLVREPNFVADRPFSLMAQAASTSHSTAGPAKHDVMASKALADQDEGDENDQLPDSEIAAILSAKESGARFRNSAVALAWPDYSEFDAFIRSLNLQNFSTDEFLVLGGAHNTHGGQCAGKNTFPPRRLWSNITQSAWILDHLRDRLGRSIVITNAYRSPVYNSCINGASNSQHTHFTALDFKVSGMDAAEVATALRWLRDKEGLFKGGIGRYASFTHIDTRGTNATWPPAFKDARLPTSSPLPHAAPQTMSERIAILESIELAEPRSMRGKKSDASALAMPVTRSGDPFDPNSGVATGQQALRATVGAASIITFVENLSPGQKEDVLLSTLFAQRAADKKADPVTDRATWFETYMRVLGVMGWTREAAPFEASQAMKGSGSFDKVVLATLAQVATGNQFSILQSAIDTLGQLADSDNRIKLFDFETSQTTGGNFQIGSAEASGEIISMALGAFNFTYSDKKRNILFVSWGKNELDYWLSAQRISLSSAIYADVREIVESRLAETRKNVVLDIEI